jgi:hypothetical protein
MQILRDVSAIHAFPAGAMHNQLEQHLANISEVEPYDPIRHGFFIVVEAGDTVEVVEQVAGYPVLGNRYSDARFGDEGFIPGWEFLEYHSGHGSTCGCYEMVFILSDDGFGVVVLIPDIPGIDSLLMQLCQQYAKPSGC